MSSNSPVHLEREGSLLWISLNRPSARNAINMETARALGAAVEMLAADDDLRVGILRGEGTAFCSGQDLKAIAAGEPLTIPEHQEWGWAGFVSHFTSKPIIAAVHGYALGGGLELALACDLVVASQSSFFALPEVRRGLFAAGGGVPRLAQHIPKKVASKYVLTGDTFTAEQALEWGLVTDVVPDTNVDSAARELALHIASNAPLAVQASKRILAYAHAAPMWDLTDWSLVSEQASAVFASRDALEGSAAFTEKREPKWTGS
ncbi:crotonase/enoyl-CoA hydratase family protein [Microbacterium sp. A93]|uniref:crotonase/enoyl-CoA hydratase family protein n=1 Tax=Microbacterium sp. A93 TaxID=3450716 RepID=UPI003F42A6CF